MENLAKVRAIFHEAVELYGSEREEYLNLATAGKLELRRRVERLLAGAELEDSFLASPTVAPDTGSAGASEEVGTLIGRYKLLQLLGEGGFGSVWVAEQQSPVVRRVALKVIKLGMDTKQVIARFEAERQALAIMDHSNIARVFDAGATEAGRPYFVMELVTGEPITTYCDTKNVTIRHRLQLFVQVCQAVQYAHAKGIIHRDLKPSNVLVSTQDGEPLTKIIDFGIAKATAARSAEKTLLTEHRQFIGTPEYMSPEQAGGELDIDTRSDVYSLGVLLYELLAGAPPFDARSLWSAGYAEIQRIIREVDPPRPSTRLSHATQGLPAIAERRQTEPAKLTRQVRGDLDWIVMKALEKDRQRRYDTASALAQDVQRHLAGEPVIAAPPSAAYRARKFVRRNRAAVTAAALVAAALVLGIIGTSIGLASAQSQRKLAQKNEQKANEEASRAHREAQRAQEAEAETRQRADDLEQVANFQAQMLDQIDATEAGGALLADLRQRLLEAIAKADLPPEERDHHVSVLDEHWQQINATDAASSMIDRAILQPAAEAIDAQFADQPLVSASLRRTLADAYAVLGRFDSALPLQEHALMSYVETVGEDHEHTIEARCQLGQLLLARGGVAEAEQHLEHALESSRRVLGDEHLLTLRCLYAMGALLRQQGDLSEAELYLREAVQLAERISPPNRELSLASLRELSAVLSSSDGYQEAEVLLRQALAVAQRDSGQDHKSTLAITNDLGLLLRRQLRLAEAAALYQYALARQRRVLGDDHPNTLRALTNLGELLIEQRRFADAEPVVREALERSRRVHGASHPQTMLTLNNMGNLLARQERFGEAEAYLSEALEHARGSEGRERPELPLALISYGGLLLDQGKAQEAELHYRQALAVSRRLLGEEHPHTTLALGRLGRFCLQQGKLDEAESLLSQAYARSRKMRGDSHIETLRILDGLAAVSWRLGKLQAAERFCGEALQRRRELLGDRHVDTIHSMIGVATLLRDRHKYPEAEAQAREAADAAKEVLGPEADQTLLAIGVLAAAFEGQRRFEEAEPLRREILEARQGRLGPKHLETLEAVRSLGKNLLDQQKATAAEPFLRTALEGFVERSESRWIADCQLLLGLALTKQQRWSEAEAELTAAEHQTMQAKVSQRRHQEFLQALVDLYAGWNAAEPGKGFDARAAQWETTLNQLATTTRPSH